MACKRSGVRIPIAPLLRYLRTSSRPRTLDQGSGFLRWVAGWTGWAASHFLRVRDHLGNHLFRPCPGFARAPANRHAGMEQTACPKMACCCSAGVALYGLPDVSLYAVAWWLLSGIEGSVTLLLSRSRTGGKARVTACCLMLVVSGAICMAGTAEAGVAPGRAWTASRASASSVSEGDATVTPLDAPCAFVPAADCESTDTTIDANWESLDDTSGCTLTWSIDWGAGGKAQTVTVDGRSKPGYYFAVRHKYARVSKTETYTITSTAESSTGGCSIEGGTLTFTLLASTCTPSAVSQPGASAVGLNRIAGDRQGVLAGKRVGGAVADPGLKGRNDHATAVTASAGAAPDSIWAGYVAVEPSGCKNYFTSVTGRWIIPTVTCPAADKGTQGISLWVGLGDASTVEQTGVYAECYWEAKSKAYDLRWYAWYEMAPDPVVRDKAGFGELHPKPGDKVEATVKYDPSDKAAPYHLTLSVAGQTRTAKEACSAACENMDASWTAEKPGTWGLPAFTPWTLTSGYATTIKNDTDQSVAALDASPLTIESGGSVQASACNLIGDSFTVQQSTC